MKRNLKLSEQMKRKVENHNTKQVELDGNFDMMISTGSTLLDLAISGKRKRGGGIPAGVFVEAFGPSQSGKTVLLCEIAGAVERAGGENQFHDPEARLDKQFASIFDMQIKDENYYQPDTVTEVFKQVRDWEVEDEKVVNGVFADSLAALSTDLEMENEAGDKMGMRRAKEFSEQLRKTCRYIKQKNLVMVCSNQVRVNADAGPYAQKHTSPGGEAIKFYSSIRLHFHNPKKIYKEVKVAGKAVKKVIGITTEIEVIKTVDSPFRKAPLTIIYDYGIDDVRENLQFIKSYTKNNTYTCNGESLGISMEGAIEWIEEHGKEESLREEVIDLWEAIEEKFASNRKNKKR